MEVKRGLRSLSRFAELRPSRALNLLSLREPDNALIVNQIPLCVPPAAAVTQARIAGATGGAGERCGIVRSFCWRSGAAAWQHQTG